MDVNTHWALSYRTILNVWRIYHNGTNFNDIEPIERGPISEDNLKLEIVIILNLPTVGSQADDFERTPAYSQE
jgi:hypothetical protein